MRVHLLPMGRRTRIWSGSSHLRKSGYKKTERRKRLASTLVLIILNPRISFGPNFGVIFTFVTGTSWKMYKLNDGPLCETIRHSDSLNSSSWDAGEEWEGYNRLRVFVLLSLLNNKIETPEGHSATCIISILQNGRDDPDLIEKSRFQLPFITQKGQGWLNAIRMADWWQYAALYIRQVSVCLSIYLFVCLKDWLWRSIRTIAQR